MLAGHDQRVICQRIHKITIMRDDQPHNIALLLQGNDNLGLRLLVNVVRRLVDNHQVGIFRQSRDNLKSFPLASRKLGPPVSPVVANTQQVA